MILKTCNNGHRYDPTITPECPECVRLAHAVIPVDLGAIDAKNVRSWSRKLKLLQGCGDVQFIASGSTCDVYRVEKGGVTYALKVMDCGFDPEKLRNAQREISVMREIASCRDVVHLIDSEILQQGGSAIAFLLEEYMTTFEQYYKNTAMTGRNVIQLGMQISSALEACWNAGIAYLDVQPKNLFVARDGRFKLGDFGSALSVDMLNGHHQLRGTLGYMAPEAYSERKYSQASDVYSLGLILYCLTNRGFLPFAERMPKEEAIRRRLAGEKVIPSREFGVELCRCIERACAYSPEDRIRSFEDLRAELAAVLLENDIYALSRPVNSRPVPKAPVTNPQCSAASAPMAAPAPARAAKRQGLFGALASAFQKEKREPAPPAPNATPPAWKPEPLSTGNLFDDDIAARTEAPVQPAPSGWNMPNRYEAAPYASPMPMAAPNAGNLFDVDTAAQTCALEAPPMPMQNSQFGYAPAPYCPPPAPSAAPSYAPPMQAPQPSYAPMPSAAPRVDQVQFSAVAPKEAMKGEYSLIQIFMYEQAFRSVVEEALEMAEAPAQEKRSGIHKVRENTRVKIILTSPDMEIYDNELEQIWSGGYLQFDFAICPPEDFRKRQLMLTAAVYFDDIPATRLMLIIKPQASYEEQIEVARKDIITAFISYASQDRARVGALVQGMRKARPDMDIFFDVNSLKSGEDWEKTLYREIEKRDILFLCWSHFAKESPWVDREWRYALERKGSDAIEPIPLEQPDICPPPMELSSKHFNDSLLYIINR